MLLSVSLSIKFREVTYEVTAILVPINRGPSVNMVQYTEKERAQRRFFFTRQM
jgi:hypothetical protein